MARKRSAAIVFLSSDSGEEYITVDGNQGDRYVLTEGLVSQQYELIPVIFAETT